jgi:hypothetical protein
MARVCRRRELIIATVEGQWAILGEVTLRVLQISLALFRI